MIYFLDGRFRETTLTFEPLSNPDARHIAHGNLWKSKERRDWPKQIAFIRELATKLSQGERSFVICHIDGDRTWEASKGGTICDHVEPFLRFIKERICNVISVRPNAKNTLLALEEAFNTRLLLVIPFYSIESWLYQNTTFGVELCNKHYQGRGADKFKIWEGDAQLLDEEIAPKDIIHFGSKHNRALAENGFPTVRVYNANKSFAKTVNSFLMCDKFMAALQTS